MVAEAKHPRQRRWREALLGELSTEEAKHSWKLAEVGQGEEKRVTRGVLVRGVVSP